MKENVLIFKVNTKMIEIVELDSSDEEGLNDETEKLLDKRATVDCESSSQSSEILVQSSGGEEETEADKEEIDLVEPTPKTSTTDEQRPTIKSIQMPVSEDECKLCCQ